MHPLPEVSPDFGFVRGMCARLFQDVNGLGTTRIARQGLKSTPYPHESPRRELDSGVFLQMNGDHLISVPVCGMHPVSCFRHQYEVLNQRFLAAETTIARHHVPQSLDC